VAVLEALNHQVLLAEQVVVLAVVETVEMVMQEVMGQLILEVAAVALVVQLVQVALVVQVLLL
jgi:hypothetical protein